MLIIIIISKYTSEVNSNKMIYLVSPFIKAIKKFGKEHEAKSELKELVHQLKVAASVNFDSNLSSPILSLVISQNISIKIISSHSAYQNKTDYIIKSNIPWVPRAAEFFVIKRK